MRLLANENFPLRSVEILQEKGFDIISISKVSPGISDEEVMNLASQEQRTILTFDSDYGELIFKKGFFPGGGVIYIRWSDFRPEEPGMYLSEIFQQGDIIFGNALTVIDRHSIRQRKY